jgi:hypothetical protein
MDVTKLIFQHVTPEVSERIGTVADLPPDEAARLMAAAIPAMLAMLLDMTGDEALEEAVREASADLRALAAADSAALETASRDGLARGAALVGPACFAAFVAALERHGGVDRDRMRRIAGIATTFSVSGIADAGRAQGLDADQSLTMFSKQTGSVALALPGAFAEQMAERRLLQGLGARAAEATAQARPAGGATNRPGAPALPAQPGNAWWRWVIPGTAMLVAIAVAIVFLGGPSVPPR